IGDQVGALLCILHAGIAHLGAGYCLQRILQEVVERLLVPGHAILLHRRRIGITFERAGLPAEQAAMARPDAVVVQRMAGKATVVDVLATGRIAGGRLGSAWDREPDHENRKETGSNKTSHGRASAGSAQDMKASGTGGWPSAWRRTAQCIASSPKIDAAALASSRSVRIGTAPR